MEMKKTLYTRHSMEVRHTGVNYLLLILVFSCLLFACKKEIHSPETNQVGTLAMEAGNLIINGNFTEWDAAIGTFSDWATVSTNSGVIGQLNPGIQFSANAAGQYYIYQRVNIAAKQFYKVSLTADYTLNDYSACGIYVMDSTMKKVIGQFEKVYNQASQENWQFIFYSGKPKQVVVVIGFLDGINGTASLNGATMEKYDYTPTLPVDVSAFSSHLNQRLGLSFSPDGFDTTISKIGDYVNTVLLSQDKFLSDTGENTILDAMIGADSAYTYFNQYRHAPSQVKDGYCQRSSLSLGEILTNEFNIPVRQMFMQFAGIGKHQFQEYWNPFSRRWIIIDPCFNTRYVKNDQLLGDEDFDRSEAPALMVRFGSHYFYDNLDELVDLWQGMDELQVSDYYTITFPFY